MSLAKDIIDIIDKSTDDNEKIKEKKEHLNRSERFAEYTIRGVNKKVNKQIMRDFTTEMEEKLEKLANSVNAKEQNNEILDILTRWFLSTTVGKFLSKLMDTQRLICDSYNYFGDTIKKIFDQARTVDGICANNLTTKSDTVAKNSEELIRKLNSSFDYYNNNKSRGCTIDYALSRIYCNNEEVDVLINEMIEANEEKKIEDFVDDERNVDVFNKYSERIYKKYINENSNSEYSISKIKKGHESAIRKIVEFAVEKFASDATSKRETVIDVFVNNKDIAKMISQLIDATGVTSAGAAAIKIYIYKQVKDKIYQNYKELFFKIRSKESDDYEQLKKLYDQLKMLEKDIIMAYREMNKYNPNKQVKANQWMYNVESQDCGSI